MTILHVENNYSWLITDDEKLKDTFWKSMRFPTRGSFYNMRYRMRLWDGYTEFFKKGTGRFLTGLLPEIKLALKYLNVPYEIEDKREPFTFAVESVNQDWLKDGGITLRDYQVDYINQVIKHKRGVIPSPTGSGKTLSMIGILKALPPKTPTLILANKTSLIEQNYDEITKYGIKNVGRFYGKKKEPNYITCSTIQSVHLLEAVLGKIKVMIVDEIHEMITTTSRKAYRKLANASIRVAMSATAFKFGETDKVQKYEVKGWFGPVFVSKSAEEGILKASDLQKQNILSEASCFFFRIKHPKLEYDIYQDAVMHGIVENDHFHDLVVKLVSKLEGRSLIIVERIEHGDRLHQRIPGSLWVQGKDDIETRKSIIAKLKKGEKVVAIATSGIFNTGIDVNVNSLINAAGGQAEHQIIQRFGRGLRVAEDKQHLMYFDFYFEMNDYLERHSKKRIKVLMKEGHDVKIYDTEVADNWTG